MQKKLSILLALLLLACIAGCGQKGPLYLPDEDQQNSKRRYGPF